MTCNLNSRCHLLNPRFCAVPGHGIVSCRALTNPTRQKVRRKWQWRGVGSVESVSLESSKRSSTGSRKRTPIAAPKRLLELDLPTSRM